MATKSVNAVLNMKNYMSKGLKQVSEDVKKVTKNTKTAQRQVKSFANGTKRNIAKVKNSFKSLTLGVGGLVAAYAGFSFMRDSAKYAKEQTIAETKLLAVLRNVKGVTEEQVHGLKNHASALQNVGVIGDEVTLAAMSQLGTFQLQAESIETLSEGMLDLLANNKGLNATQQDAQNIGNLVGKVMQGQVGSLSRLGISFSKAQEQVLKYGTEQEKAAILAEVLKQNVGGVNKALAQQDNGKIQQMTNAWGDLKEVVGFTVNKALANFSGWFVTKIPIIQDNFFKLKEKALEIYVVLKEKWGEIQPQVDLVKKSIIKLTEKAKGFYKYVSKNWDTIGPMVMTIVGAMIAYKTATAAVKVVTLALAAAEVVKNAVLVGGATTINALTIAQWAWNAAMEANPIGMIIGIFTAVILAGVAVYKNWDTIKEKARQLWGALKKYFSKIKESIIDKVNKISEAWSNMWEGIKNKSKRSINWVIDKINGLIELINKIPLVEIGEIKKLEVDDNTVRTDNNGPIDYLPHYATGTAYFKGGYARVNEHGGEIAKFPNGTTIIPADKSEKILNSSSQSSITVNFYGDLYGDSDLINKVGNAIAGKVKLALKNI